jgi:phosphoribosylanthranilate isomerase
VWVKICGITNSEDALMSVAMGADAVGFVFAPSERQVTVGAVRDISKRMPLGVMRVGVFRDHSPEQVIDTVLGAGLHAAQLHGHETPSDARAIKPRVQALMVAFPAGSSAIERYDEYEADAMLLDAASPGSGKVFDWSLADGIPPNRRLVLSGGLDPANVAGGIAQVEPWGVDVSTGVEASPGVKDPRKIRAFIRNARGAFEALERDPSEGPGPFDWHEDGV